MIVPPIIIKSKTAIATIIDVVSSLDLLMLFLEADNIGLKEVLNEKLFGVVGIFLINRKK